MLILGELTVGRNLVRAVARAANLPRSSLQRMGRFWNSIEFVAVAPLRRWRGRSVNGVLLILTCAVTVFSLWGAKDWLTGGWQFVGDRMTLAGWWYLLISLPVMRFLALRWLWRLLLWAWFLWKVSRLELRPRPAHPDRAGGLAFLGATQAAFGVLVFAFGVQLSCLIADAVHFRGADPVDFRGQLIAFVVIMVGGLLLPLLVFAPTLARAREEQLPLMSASAHRGAGNLAKKLRTDQTGELPVEAVSSLSDFGALYENARMMRTVPLENRHIVMLLLAAVLPFVPLVFLVMPAREVLRTLAALLV